MATSMESQLKLFKSKYKTDTDAPGKTITKPSLLYDPRTAADFDIHQIYDLSFSGLEILIVTEERFRNYKNDLFDPKSRGMDRELMTDEENERINTTISSYLRLLSGFLQLPSAIKTLEYLIRRYKIHVYNSEDLILCALPFHDTHDFVRIVQLIDFRNTRWKFLDGVKKTGAPPPRKVIVQQCTRDIGVLETICKYATPTKKHQPSTPAISFSTAVVVEFLGSLPTVDSDVVQKILPFLDSGLQSGCKGSSDFKAGMLMILGLVTKRAALSPKLVGYWIRSVAELAQADMQVSGDTQWVELSIMALANMVQLQSVQNFHKKAVDILKGIRDLPKILSQLTMRFNIDRFVMLLIESFMDYSSSDSCCRLAITSIVDDVPIKGIVKNVVFSLFSSCLRLWQKADASEWLELGSWAKEVLFLLDKKYLHELRAAVHEFLDNKKILLKFKDEKSVIEALCKILDGNVKSTGASSDTMIWFALEHPMAEFRRAALLNLDSSILNGESPSQRLVNVKDCVSRSLIDVDLSVVQAAALSLDKLPGLVEPASLLAKIKELLRRCTLILWSSASKDHSLATEVVISCLKHLVSISVDGSDLLEEIALLIFPLLLVFPKTKMVNLKAQELAKSIKWPLYSDVVSTPNLKKAGKDWYSKVNMSIVHSLVTVFSSDVEKFMPWLVRCCSESELSKTLFYMVLMESSVMQKKASNQLFETCFAYLKQEWRSLELAGDFSYGQEFNIKILDADDTYLLNEFDGSSMENLNAKLLVFVFWRLIKVYNSTIPTDVNVDDDGEWISSLRDLYVFFAECNLKHHFKEHRHYLVQNSRFSPVRFLSTFVSVEGYSSQVQVESLHSLSMLCSQADETSSSQLFAGFPLILVPLSSDVQDVRTAAMLYVEQLGSLISRVKSGGKKNGNIDSWIFFLDELLSLLIQQKKMILSDRDFLPSLLVSILSSSSHSLLVPKDLGQRFEKSTAEGILTFVLGSAMKFPGHAKLKVLSLLKELGGAIVRVTDVDSLLRELLQRRRSYHLLLDRSYQELSNVDVDILCLLIEICSMPASLDIRILEEHLLPALWIDEVVSGDAAVVRPCVTFLKNLNENLYSSLNAELKLSLFQRLVLLYHDADNDVQNATRDALLRLDISCSTASQILDSILVSEIDTVSLSERKAKKSKKHEPATFLRGKDVPHVLSSLLDVLLLKKDMTNRALLLKPLFKLLERVFSDQWVTSVPATLSYIQQTLLLILEDIVASLPTDGSLSDAVFDKFDAGLLVNCAQSTTDFTTCNHVYSLFAAISKVATDKILLHVPDILAVLGKSTAGNDDSHSNRVFEEFISTVVPFWTSKMDGGVVKLLQIFVNVMADIAQHRRLPIVLHLLKTLGQSNSLGSLLVLLFRALVSKQNESADFMDVLGQQTEWELNFAEQICEQYTSVIWLPSVVSMLKQILEAPQNNELFLILLLAMRFIMGKLEDPEFVFKLQSLEDMGTIQATLGELMVQTVLCWQLVDLSRKNKSIPSSLKKDLKELIHSVVIKITKGMLPSTFFQGISNMLALSDKSARKKALQVLCETVKDSGAINSKRAKGASVRVVGAWSNLSGRDLESFSALCLEILQLLDKEITSPVRLAAISAVEVLAYKFPSHHTIFSRCLSSVVRNIFSDDHLVVTGCLRTSAALIGVLGARSLPELPRIMKSIFKITRDATSDDQVMLTIVSTLEALVDNLGSFLSPYLGDIIDLLVLNPDCVSEANVKLKARADGVKKLLSEKVLVRLALPALQNVYTKAVELGDQSVCAVFELVKNFVSNMDKPSVSGYHTNIFDFCMLALDLRSQHGASLENINAVEKSVIDAVVSLSMKMTESMFKPLFIRSIEWVESKMEVDNGTGRNISRAVSFYGLVNKLAENHRSLFVPYFKYLLESSIKHLTDDDGHLRKKKKAKVQKSENVKTDRNEVALLENWHLRALVLSSLHKCFLYDIGSLKFMDSSKFHLVLKPIVSQLVIAPPASLKDNPNLPSVEEVDDILVSCLGQLAVTAGSDLLWKPLNHEVLMQTRSEMMRSRLLGLRIVKYLVENLKEEFLVLLAETIPFLAELLEDVELPVKTLAQEILKELESMSGENLRDYF